MNISVESLPAARNRAHYVRGERGAWPGWETRQQFALRYTETGKGLDSLPRACDTSRPDLSLERTHWLVLDRPSSWQQPHQLESPPFPEAPPGPAPGKGRDAVEGVLQEP